MKKQYIVQKYVMAESASEALEKAKKLPVHEVFVHNGWLDKVAGNEFFATTPAGLGFKKHEN